MFPSRFPTVRNQTVGRWQTSLEVVRLRQAFRRYCQTYVAARP
jgi:hypothetical protein